MSEHNQHDTDFSSLLFDQAPVMMMLVGEDMRVRRVNRALEEFFSGKLDKPNERYFGEILSCFYLLDGLRQCMDSDSCDQCTVLQTIRESFAAGKSQSHIEVKFLVSNGRDQDETHLLMSTAPLDADGRTDMLVCLENITQSTHALEDFKRSNEMRQRILDTAATAIFMIDPELRIIGVNQEFCASTGYTPTEIIGEHCAILQPTPCSETCNLFNSQNPVSITREHCTIISKDGRKLSIIKNASLTTDENNQVNGAIESFVDVTELVEARKQTEIANEELAVANEQLERAVDKANQLATAAEMSAIAKSQFLANMSHEIRTPMNGVLGMTTLLLDTQLNDEQRDYANTLRTSGESLLTLINDILDFSKIEAGKLTLDPIEFRLRDSVNDTLSTFSMRAKEKKIELLCDVDPDLPEALVGDPGRLRQILINLVGNSLKFTEKGEIVLTVAAEEQTDTHATLLFSVRDTGIGIPPDKLDLIFEHFAQADGSTTRKYGGTGLGLTITKNLVQLMSGRIWVESEATGADTDPDNIGSTFLFTARFGISEKPLEEPPADQPTREIPEGLSVLVVDDNASCRHILNEMLLRMSLVPTMVEDGFQALQALEKAEKTDEKFHILVLDIQMPGMDGFELVKRFRDNSYWKDLTVIILTGAGERGDGVRCRELGIAGYMVKPFKQSELRQTILDTSGRGLAPSPKQPLVTRHSIRESKQALRILLAEDNKINQKLASRLLEKQGHQVDIVENGKLAVDIYRQHPYDIILMDVQMPVMDGFEATRAIRLQELGSPTHIPIIAMTAHAMKGYREKCLQAGMDDYVSKPVNPELLFKAIDAHAKKTDETAPEEDLYYPHDPQTVSLQFPQTIAPAPEKTNDKDILDWQQALARVGNDNELLEELINLFMEEAPGQLDKLQDAFARQDAAAAERIAHSIKGASANLSAENVRQAAYQIELATKDKTLQKARELYPNLQNEFQRFQAALTNPPPEAGFPPPSPGDPT